MVVTSYLEDARHGVFATRAPARPNRIGMSPVRLLGVDGNVVHLQGVDMLDATPLLDVKPYARRFDRFQTRRNGWLDAVRERSVLADG